MNRVKKATFITLGTMCVGLGVVGIFLPLMPTTVFLLAAAYFYSRSDERFYGWLLDNRVFGEYIRNYREGRGMTLKHKTRALAVLWTTIAVSIWLVESIAVRLVLFLVASGVSIFLLRFVPTYRPENSAVEQQTESVSAE
ncbi:MAG: YbaN family protein [Pyrinomonadaceae bacterium]